MGNNPSTHSKSSIASPASSTHGQQPATTTGSSPAPSSERRREPKLRESVHGQKGAPPESSQVQARGTTTHRTRPSQGQKEQPSSQPPSYAQAQAHSHSHSNSPSQSHSASPRQYSPYPPQPVSRSQNASPAANNTPYSASPKERVSSSQQRPQAPKTESYQSTPAKSNTPPQYIDQPSKPVAVPQPTNTPTTVDASADIKSPPFAHSEHAGMVADTMSYHLTRPPRLPLPIEEEVHTPGSPILGPADSQAPLPDLDPLEMGEGLTRPLSPTETDDEDGEELPVDRSKPTVKTLFTWHGDVNTSSTSKVYVTGTIFQWSRKHKLDHVPGKPGYFEGQVNVRPGTHHIRFIVDGNMSLSPDLPTTVDFGNNLVNYIEVSADDAQPPQEVQGASQIPQQPHQDQLTSVPSHEEDSGQHTAKQPQRTKAVLSRDHYTSDIPQYLLDLDKAEDSAAYQYAAAAIVKLPTPPSLPGFLGKPILNAATPMKDDNSVLNMPNHTVLNHLATSSIKGNVLAVSATTRYKRKYVTTIMYKPTSDDTT